MSLRKFASLGTIVLICMLNQPAAKAGLEVGVWHGTLEIPEPSPFAVNTPILLSIDVGDRGEFTPTNLSNRFLAYASLRASLACFDAVQVFVGDGTGSAGGRTTTGTISARCPDKSLLSFEIQFTLDTENSGTLTFPGRNLPAVSLERVEFSPAFFRSGIKEMLNNDRVWVLQELFDHFKAQDNTCPPGQYASAMVDGKLQCRTLGIYRIWISEGFSYGKTRLIMNCLPGDIATFASLGAGRTDGVDILGIRPVASGAIAIEFNDIYGQVFKAYLTCLSVSSGRSQEVFTLDTQWRALCSYTPYQGSFEEIACSIN